MTPLFRKLGPDLSPLRFFHATTKRIAHAKALLRVLLVPCHTLTTSGIKLLSDVVHGDNVTVDTNWSKIKTKLGQGTRTSLVFCTSLSTFPVPVLSLSSTNFVSIVKLLCTFPGKLHS